MKISIIVVNYNGKEHIENCINSILKQNFPKKQMEIIVVDNNSHDESWKIVEKYKKIKLIKNEKNMGFAEGNNIGIRKAKGRYIVLFNDDLIVDKNWIGELFHLMQNDKKIGSIGGKIFYKKTKEVWFGGAKVYFGAFVNHRYLNEHPGESDYIAGAAVMYRKSVLDKIGLFDKKFFLYAEDIDLGRRIREAGYKNFYFPKAVSYHIIEKDRVSGYQEYYEQRNRFYLCYKQYHTFISKVLFILADLFFLFPLFWLNRILKNPKKLKFWRECFKARVDSLKMMFYK